MNTIAAAVPINRPRIVRPIAVGGAIAGTLDLISAFITYGWGVPKGIASGVLGTSAFQGGIGTWFLGVVLHYTIAFGAAAVFCLAAAWLPALAHRFWVTGPLYGIVVYFFMQRVVLPLSAFPFRGQSTPLPALIQGVAVHMILIGLPVAFSARRFSR
jgi:hypothetical protein